MKRIRTSSRPGRRPGRRIRRFVLIGGSIFLASLQLSGLIVVCLVLAWRAEPARFVLTRWISMVASGASAQRIRLGTLEGPAPWNLRIPAVQIADDDGLWLEARDVRLRLDLSAARRRVWRLPHAQVGSLTIMRWPDFPPRDRSPRDRTARTRPDFRIDHLRVGRFKAKFMQPPVLATLDGSVIAADAEIAFQGQLQATGGDAGGVVKGHVAWSDRQPLRLDLTAALETGPQMLRAAGWSDPLSEFFTARAVLRGTLESFEVQTDLHAHALGTARIRVHGRWTAEETTDRRNAELHLSGRITPETHAEPLAQWDLTDLLFDGRIGYDGASAWQLRALHLTVPHGHARLSGSAVTGSTGPQFNLEAELAWVPPATWALHLPFDFLQPLRAVIRMDGTAEAWQADATLQPGNLKVPKWDWTMVDPRIETSLNRDAAGWTATAHVASEALGGAPLRMVAQAAAPADANAGGTLQADWSGIGAETAFAWNPVASNLTFEAIAQVDPGPLYRQFGEPAGDAPQGEIAATVYGQGVPSRQSWQFRANLAAHDLVYRSFSSHGVDLSAWLDLRGSRRNWQAVSTLTEVRFEPLILQQGSVWATGTGPTMITRLAGQGRLQDQPFALRVRGGMMNEAQRFDVRELHLATMEIVLENDGDLRIDRMPDRVVLHPAALTADGMRLTLNGWIDPDDQTFDWHTRITGPLEQAGPRLLPQWDTLNLGGRIDVRGHLEGSARQPRGTLQGGLWLAESAGGRIERHALLDLTATLAEPGLNAIVRANLGELGRARLDATIPLTPHPEDGPPFWAPGEDAEAALQADVDLFWLLTPWIPHQMRLSGHGNADLSVRWHPGGVPRFSGRMDLEPLAMEAPQWGLLLQAGQIGVTAAPDAEPPGRLELAGTLEDHDGQSLRLRGGMALDASLQPQGEAVLETARFHLLRTEDFVVTLAADLALRSPEPGTGVWSATGTLELLDLNILGIPTLPLDMESLLVEDIWEEEPRSVPERAPDPPAPAPRTVEAPFRYDLEFRMTPECVISAPDTRMRWQGRLRLRGQGEQHEITGQLDLVRGYVQVLGRRFQLAQGRLVFAGDDPIPEIDAVAEARGGGITAQILVTGPLTRPSIRITSDPPMAEDEVLAYVLFRRNLSRIGPYQAYQLAQVLRRLHGGGGGLDLLGYGRRLLPVDEIDVVYAEGANGGEETAALSIGKYVGSNLYVSGTQGLELTTGRLSIELELTRNLILETEVRADMRTGLGLNWKWDY